MATWDILKPRFAILPESEYEEPNAKRQKYELPIIPSYGRDQLLQKIEQAEKNLISNTWTKVGNELVEAQELPWFTPEHENFLLQDASQPVKISTGSECYPPGCVMESRCIIRTFKNIQNSELVKTSTKLWSALTPDEVKVFMKCGELPKNAEGVPERRACILCQRYAIGVETFTRALGEKVQSSQWYKNTVGVIGGYDKLACFPSAHGMQNEGVIAPIAALHCTALEWKMNANGRLYVDQSRMMHGSQHFC